MSWTPSTMSTRELGLEIYNACYLTGDFLLRSGTRSSEYFDKYQFESRPHLLRVIAEKIRNQLTMEIEILAGLEMGGIPVATAVSLSSNLPLIMVRKKAKDYGTCKIAEGQTFEDKNVLIIEDVITTGGQVVESTKALRAAGARVDSVFCVIDRSGGHHDRLKEAGLTLRSLFTAEQLKEYATN